MAFRLTQGIKNTFLFTKRVATPPLRLSGRNYGTQLSTCCRCTGSKKLFERTSVFSLNRTGIRFKSVDNGKVVLGTNAKIQVKKLWFCHIFWQLCVYLYSVETISLGLLIVIAMKNCHKR